MARLQLGACLLDGMGVFVMFWRLFGCLVSVKIEWDLSVYPVVPQKCDCQAPVRRIQGILESFHLEIVLESSSIDQIGMIWPIWSSFLVDLGSVNPMRTPSVTSC